MATAELTPGAEEPARDSPGTRGARIQESLTSADGAQARPGASVSQRGGPSDLAQAIAGADLIKLSILMPVYNEEHTIAQAVGEILRADFPCNAELIIVDDGSTDATPALLAAFTDARVRIHRHPANRGKGAAIMTALSLVTGTHVLPFDADLEYSAEDIPRMLKPVIEGRATVVYGARLSGVNTVYRSYRYALGNRLLSNMANLLFNAWITDLHTCFKLIPVTLLRGLKLREKGFGLDTEVTALLLRQGIRPFEVPVSYYGRSHAQGKKITWRDGVVCARVLLRIRLSGRSRQPASDGAPADRGYTAPNHPRSLAVPADLACEAPERVDSADGGDDLTVSFRS